MRGRGGRGRGAVATKKKKKMEEEDDSASNTSLETPPQRGSKRDRGDSSSESSDSPQPPAKKTSQRGRGRGRGAGRGHGGDAPSLPFPMALPPLQFQIFTAPGPQWSMPMPGPFGASLPPVADPFPHPAPTVDWAELQQLIVNKIDPVIKSALPDSDTSATEEDVPTEKPTKKTATRKKKAVKRRRSQAFQPPNLSEDDEKLLMAGYELVLRTFHDQCYRHKYGARPHDLRHFHLPPRAAVPSYFANVKTGSIYERKLLSLLGLRNLVFYGPSIFCELQKALFSSFPGAYSPHEGIHKMRHFTGNAVDLDTCVLRCSDPTILKTINAKNKAEGERTFRSGDEFGESKQARQIAVTATRPLLTSFCEKFKLTPLERKKRAVDPGSLNIKKIPRASSNSERGRWPLWHYANVGQNSFHANVPNMPDVVGSVLLSPYHLLTAYAKVMLLSEKLRQVYQDAFFEDCVVDACFNLKWKAIEEFNALLASLDTIGRVIGETQRDHQQQFMKIYDDTAMDDDQKEEAELKLLCELLDGHEARDAKTNITRKITR
eukprot:Sspe_Gene.10646::Locus_3561_Transcript_1_1_Confidence_1.000_Length_1664::g.10646::m.10646